MYRNLLVYLFFIVMIPTGCNNLNSTADEVDLKIKLSSDSSSILLCNLPPDLLAEFEKHPADTNILSRFFAVYEEPSDPDLKDLQKPIAGKYELQQNTLAFKPQQAFKKGQAYYAQVYIKKMSLNPISMLQNKAWKDKGKPVEFKFRY